MCVFGQARCYIYVLITFQFDIRAAERARERLQGSEISGRPVRIQRLNYQLTNYHSLYTIRLMFTTPFLETMELREVARKRGTR